MKFGTLKSIGHNLADSLASGACFIVDYSYTEIFQEALNCPEGQIEVDFLSGAISKGNASKGLKRLTLALAENLDEFCMRHGAKKADFKMLKAKFATDRTHGAYFEVKIESRTGRKSVDQYIGIPGRKRPRARSSPYRR